MANKTNNIHLRISEAEKQNLKEKAKQANMNISEYMVASALKKDIIVVEDLKDFTHQLSKVGVNLNQITMLAHQGKVQCIDLDSVKKVVMEIWRLLSSLKARTQPTKE